jgi:triosephosphate isomerase (TIM)
MTKLIAGNWKMNGLKASLNELKEMASVRIAGTTLVICPPATLLTGFADALDKTGLKLGAQDCHAKVAGAHTGDLSAPMLVEAGAHYIIVGHSERRTDHKETDALVAAKATAAIEAGAIAIICIGETESERDAGKTLDVCGIQLAGSVPDGAGADNIVIAYEPVWAIGTGRTPTAADVATVHAHIRKALVARFGAAGQGIAILYGGSVKPGNAAELLNISDVNGALVGGASLKAVDFLGIARAAVA